MGWVQCKKRRRAAVADLGSRPDVVLVCGKPHVGARERNLPPDVGTRGTTPLPDVGTRRHTSMSGTSEQLGMRPRCSDPTFAPPGFFLMTRGNKFLSCVTQKEVQRTEHRQVQDIKEITKRRADKLH